MVIWLVAGCTLSQEAVDGCKQFLLEEPKKTLWAGGVGVLSVRGAPVRGRPCGWRGGCTHLLFEERPVGGTPRGWRVGVLTFCSRSARRRDTPWVESGCTHLLFEERPSEGDPLLELFAFTLVLRLGLHLDLALVGRQQLVLLLQTLLLLLRLRHLRLVQLYLHHNKNGKCRHLLTGGSSVAANAPFTSWLAGV